MNFSSIDVFYNLPSSISTRVTGMGYGTKYQIDKNSPATPGPGAYPTRSFFKSKSERQIGFSIAIGRDVFI